jgi:hypothetical protein
MHPDPTVLATMVFVFSISIAGILAGLGRQWLKVRAQHQALRDSNRELEENVDRLERAAVESSQRLENLETIIVSQTWSALQKPGLAEAERQHRIVAARPHDVHAPAAEDMNRQRAAELAQRLGG